MLKNLEIFIVWLKFSPKYFFNSDFFGTKYLFILTYFFRYVATLDSKPFFHLSKSLTRGVKKLKCYLSLSTKWTRVALTHHNCQKLKNDKKKQGLEKLQSHCMWHCSSKLQPQLIICCWVVMAWHGITTYCKTWGEIYVDRELQWQPHKIPGGNTVVLLIQNSLMNIPDFWKKNSNLKIVFQNWVFNTV